MNINRERAKQATEKLTEQQLGKELFNLLLVYAESDDEDEGLIKKIRSKISTIQDLIEILSNTNAYESEIIQTQRIKDFFACMEYIKRKNISPVEKGIILYELNFNDDSFINHLQKEVNLSLGFLGEILTWIETSNAKYSIIYYVENNHENRIKIRVTKQKTVKQIPEYHDRTFKGHDIIHRICTFSGKTIFELLDMDEEKVNQ